MPAASAKRCRIINEEIRCRDTQTASAKNRQEKAADDEAIRHLQESSLGINSERRMNERTPFSGGRVYCRLGFHFPLTHTFLPRRIGIEIISGLIAESLALVSIYQQGIVKTMCLSKSLSSSSMLASRENRRLM